MYLTRKCLLLQKDDRKELYKYPSEHSDYMDVLAQVWEYVVCSLYVPKYEGRCQCESAADYVEEK